MDDPTITYTAWPDAVDAVTVAIFLAIAVGIPALGYACLVADFRAYMRSLRRALVRVVNYLPALPNWARSHTPRCFVPFGLKFPCTQEELMAAYRAQVKELHPDRGGDRKRFLILQRFFEEALELVRQHDALARVGQEDS
jgi:hypothetical protein